MYSFKKLPFVFLLLISATILIFSACSNSTSGEHEEHAEAEGFRIYSGEDVLVEQLPDESPTGFIQLIVGEPAQEFTVRFISHDGDEFQPEDDEYNLKHEFSDLGIADFSASNIDKWQFSLTGTETGDTELTLLLYHGDDHDDFTSGAIPVSVVEGN